MLVDTDAKGKYMEEILSESEVIAWDTETNMTEDAFRRYLVGMSLATADYEFYIPLGHKDVLGQMEFFGSKGPMFNFPAGVEYVESALISQPPKTIVMHNAKFDLTVLERAGIKVRGNIQDTMLMSHLIDEHPPHGLKELGALRLGRAEAPEIAKMLKNLTKDVGYEGVHPAAMSVYAEQDARLTYDLYFNLLPELEEQGLMDVYLNDLKFMRCLMQIELRGVRLDQERSRLLSQHSGTRMDQIQRELGFDPKSLKALAGKLYGLPPEGLGLTPASLSPKTGKPQMNEAALTSINHPIAGLVLEYRGLAKAKSTWYDGFLTRLDQDGRLHPNFKQTGTITGRPSCENPNLAQIPREAERVKVLFLPDEEHELWEFDFSQQEFHLAALYGNETEIIDRLRVGDDFHTITSEMLKVARYEAKQGNFAAIYGGQAGAISRALGISYYAAQVFLDHMKKTLPGIFKAMEEAEFLARSNGWVQYWNGRRRHFTIPGEERRAFNSVCQGGGFEITKRALLNLDAWGYKMVNQVYDSVWINLPKPVIEEEVRNIIGIMNDWTEEMFGLKFPVDAKRLN